MNREEEDKVSSLEIPIPFEELPPDRQKRIRRSVYSGSLVFLLLVSTFVAGLYAYTSHKKRQAAEEWQSPRRRWKPPTSGDCPWVSRL